MIPDNIEVNEEKNRVEMISLDQVRPRKDQPRKTFNDEAIEELASSIKEYGLIQPIIVAKLEDGYEIIAGERRFRACQKLGMDKITSIVRDYDKESLDIVAVIENIQREDLNPMEEALAYRSIMDDYDLTQKELADRLGKSRSYIANSLRLINLDDLSKEKLLDGSLTSSQARALLGIKDLDDRKNYLDKIINKELTVNELEKKGKKIRDKKEKDIYLQEIEDRLKETLGTKVSILKKQNSWDLTIEAYSEDQLESLIEYLINGREV